MRHLQFGIAGFSISGNLYKVYAIRILTHKKINKLCIINSLMREESSLIITQNKIFSI